RVDGKFILPIHHISLSSKPPSDAMIGASALHESPMARSAGNATPRSAEPTLADRITEMLAAQIRSGAYPVNARLPTEKFMTEQYGVSRTVIREAISRLKSEGLVETRQGS